MAMMSIESPEKARRMPQRISWELRIATIFLAGQLIHWLLIMVTAYLDQTYNTDSIKNSIIILSNLAFLFSTPICIFIVLFNIEDIVIHGISGTTLLSLTAYGLSTALAVIAFNWITNPYFQKSLDFLAKFVIECNF